MLWHYATGNHYVSIVKDGLILPATTYVPVGEKPIAWFSTEELFEPTAAKLWLNPHGEIQSLQLDEMLERNILPVRIGVDSAVAPHRWSDLKALSGMSCETANALASRAKRLEANPSRWRGTFQAVCAKRWRAIEYFNRREWEPLDYRNPMKSRKRIGEVSTRGPSTPTSQRPC